MTGVTHPPKYGGNHNDTAGEFTCDAGQIGCVHAKVVRESEPGVGWSVVSQTNYPRPKMEYNIEKINVIGKLLAEVIEEAMREAGSEGKLIGDVEMAMRESLREIGQSTLKYILENAEGEIEAEAEIECNCGGKLQYQRRRTATIWSVFGKVTYKRAYYAGCACGKGCAITDQGYGIEPGTVTAGLAHLLALSGIDKAFEKRAGMATSVFAF